MGKKGKDKGKGRKRKIKETKKFDLFNYLSSITKINKTKLLFLIRKTLLALYILSMPLVIYLKNTEYGYTKSIYSIFFISLMLVIWAVEMLYRNRNRKGYAINLTRLFIPGVLLITVAALSMIASQSLGVSLQSLVMLAYFFFLYLILVNTAKTERDIHLFLGCILAAAFIASVYGLLQYYGLMAGTPGVPRGSGAIISTLGNRNYLGGFITYLFIPSLILIFRASLPLRIFALIGLGTMLTTLLAINSAGAWVSLSVAGLFLILGAIWFRAFKLINENKVWVVALVGVLIIAFLFQDAPGPLNSLLGFSADSDIEQRSIFQRGVDFIKEIWRRNAGRVRAWDWWVGWEMFKDQPILGAGLGNYKIKFLPYKAQFLQTERGKHYDFYILRAAQAHNEYVQVTAEMGILGALAAAFLIGTIFWDLLVKLKRNPPRNRFLLLALFGGVVAFLTHCLVSFPLRLPASSLNFVLFLGLLQGGFFGKPKNIKLSQRRIWAVVASIFLLTVPVTVLAYQDFLADVYLDAGITNLKKGRYSLARTELERSIKLDFQPTQSLFYLGIVYKNLGEREKSIKTLERSLKHFIVEPTYLHLGELYIATGDYGKAEERLKELLSMHPSPLLKLSARYLLAVVDIKRGDIQEGMARLEDIVKEHKDYERAYVIMGQVYLDQGDLKGAAKSFQKALDIVGEKLERINRRLVKLKEIGEATLDEYFQLRGEKERLEGMEKELKKILAGL